MGEACERCRRISLKKFDKKVPIELIGYDDQGKPDELLKLIERLVQQDKVDMLLSPYATHMNMAAAPLANRLGYPGHSHHRRLGPAV